MKRIFQCEMKERRSETGREREGGRERERECVDAIDREREQQAERKEERERRRKRETLLFLGIGGTCILVFLLYADGHIKYRRLTTHCPLVRLDS